jgi:hypothetical protein
MNTDDVMIPSQETRTRNSHKFKYSIPRTTRDVFKYPRTLRDWNSLPKEIVLSETLDLLKITQEVLEVITFLSPKLSYLNFVLHICILLKCIIVVGVINFRFLPT